MWLESPVLTELNTCFQAGTSPGDWYKLRPENMQYIAGRVATPSVRSASAFFTNYRDTVPFYSSCQSCPTLIKPSAPTCIKACHTSSD